VGGWGWGWLVGGRLAGLVDGAGWRGWGWGWGWLAGMGMGMGVAGAPGRGCWAGWQADAPEVPPSLLLPQAATTRTPRRRRQWQRSRGSRGSRGSSRRTCCRHRPHWLPACPAPAPRLARPVPAQQPSRSPARCACASAERLRSLLRWLRPQRCSARCWTSHVLLPASGPSLTRRPWPRPCAGAGSPARAQHHRPLEAPPGWRARGGRRSQPGRQPHGARAAAARRRQLQQQPGQHVRRHGRQPGARPEQHVQAAL
jgi:hypothetical protein